MIRDLLAALRDAGVPVDDSIAKRVEIKIRQQYGGERVYIQSLPKQRRAAEVMAARQVLGTAAVTVKRISLATGIPARTIQRIKNGR